MSKDADVQRMRVDGGNARQPPTAPRTAAGPLQRLRRLLDQAIVKDGYHSMAMSLLDEAEAAAPAPWTEPWAGPLVAKRYESHSKHDDWWCECGHPYRLTEAPGAAAPAGLDVLDNLLRHHNTLHHGPCEFADQALHLLRERER